MTAITPGAPNRPVPHSKSAQATRQGRQPQPSRPRATTPGLVSPWGHECHPRNLSGLVCPRIASTDVTGFIDTIVLASVHRFEYAGASARDRCHTTNQALQHGSCDKT